jgi:hypothetical protein
VTASILARGRLVAAVGAVATGLVALPLAGTGFGLGVAAAGLWGVLSMWTLEGLPRAAVLPAGARRNGRAVLVWTSAKIGVYVIAICALIRRPFPAESLLVGLTWLPIALVVAGLQRPPREDPGANSRG